MPTKKKSASKASVAKPSSSKPPKATRPYMPGYGVPKGSKGLLPWSWAEERLEKSHSYWISTARPDGSPHMMVIWGLWMDGGFCFSTGAQSRKGRNLANNPKCVIGNEKADEAVVVEGEAQLTSDPAVLKRFGQAYQKKYKWDMSDSSEPVYVMRPRVAFGLYEKKFAQSMTRWVFG